MFTAYKDVVKLLIFWAQYNGTDMERWREGLWILEEL